MQSLIKKQFEAVIPVFKDRAEWLAHGVSIAVKAEESIWDMGEWMLANEGDKYGQKYDDAERIFGLSNGRCRNIHSTVKAFYLSRQRDNLTFKHYEVAMALPDKKEREKFLDIAEKEKLPATQLKQRIGSTIATEKDNEAGERVGWLPAKLIEVQRWGGNQGDVTKWDDQTLDEFNFRVRYHVMPLFESVCAEMIKRGMQQRPVFLDV